MSSPPSTNPACKAMGVRTNRETGLQLYFIWGMIDAAIYPLMKGLEQHGYKFQIMPAARRKRKEKEELRSSAASEEFIDRWSVGLENFCRA